MVEKFSNLGVYVGVIGVLYIVLTINVIKNRTKAKVALGHNDNQYLLRAIRAHANLIEYATPYFLLAFIAEYNGLSQTLVHTLSSVLVIGRLSHAFSLLYMELRNPSLIFRIVGMTLTLIPIMFVSIYNLVNFFLR